MYIKIDKTQVKFESQGHRSKVKVTGSKKVPNYALSHSTTATTGKRIKLPYWPSGKVHMGKCTIWESAYEMGIKVIGQLQGRYGGFRAVCPWPRTLSSIYRTKKLFRKVLFLTLSRIFFFFLLVLQ